MPVSGASLHFNLYRDAVNPGANPSGNYTGPWRDKLTAADGTAWTGTFAAADGDASLDSLRFAGGTTLSKATGALTIDWENATEARIRSELTWNAIKNIALDQFDGTKLTIENFVDVLLALSANTIDQSVIIDGAKRGKIDLGSGNDTLWIGVDSNTNDWGNSFIVNAGAGDDHVTLARATVDYSITGGFAAAFQERWTSRCW